jgi:cobyrinic acid a,c-diamide synthase
MHPGVQLAGVVLNRVGSDGHLTATAEAIRDATGLPVLGSLPNDPTLDRLAEVVAQRFDLDALLRIAASAPPLVLDTAESAALAKVARIAVAQDRVFGFYYEDTMDVLRDSGADLIPFSLLEDAALPDATDGLSVSGRRLSGALCTSTG